MNGITQPQKQATIIGGGIVGILSGIALLKEGLDVTLIERDEFGAGASQGNAGVLGSGTCVPMSDPSVPRQLPKWFVDPMGPMSIQWKHAPTIAPWILKFLIAGQMKEVERISIALRELHQPTVAMYRGLVAETGHTDLVRQNGYLHVYTGADFQSPPLGAALRQKRGVTLDYVSQDELRQLEPDLSSRYTHGFLVQDDGFTVNPRRLVQSLGAYYQQLGGKTIKGDVKDFEFDGDKPIVIRTNGGRIPIQGDLVIAAGVWSRELAKYFGIESAIEAERGYNVTIPNSGVSLSRTIMFADKKVLATPMEDGLRLAGTTEFANLYARPNYKRADMLLRVGREIFTRLNTEGHTRWMGMRPTTPDSLPLIGRLTNFNSVIFACGHGHTGMAGAPMTAQLVTALVTGKPTPIDIEAFSPERFTRKPSQPYVVPWI